MNRIEAEARAAHPTRAWLESGLTVVRVGPRPTPRPAKKTVKPFRQPSHVRLVK